MITLTRRQFLASSAAAAGGLVLPLRLFAQADLQHLTPWIRIATDESVVLYVSQSELGQGIYTGLTQMLADELEADWTKIRLERAPVRAPYQVTIRGRSFQGTFASSSTALMGPALKDAGAAAREMLVAAGANAWKVPVAECRAEAGWVVHASSGRRASYGQLAAAAAQLPVPSKPRLKTRAEYRYVGKPMARLDTPPKTNGSAQFGIDVRVPGMLYAAVRHCPVHGGKIAGYNEAAIRAMPGVKAIVPLGGALAVVADHYWQAERAADALDLKVDAGGSAEFSTERYSAALRAALDGGKALPSAERGAGAAAFKDAARVLQADYEVPYLAHAPLEPPCATADVSAGSATVWAPTQQQTFNVLALSKALGLAPDAIRLNTTQIGGSFGRKNPPDFVVQAALVSKAVGKPVKLIWSREQDIRHDRYRPAFAGRIRAGLDADGNILVIGARLAAQSLLAQVNPAWLKDGVDETTTEGTATMSYAIPSLYVDSVNMEAPVSLYFWRSVGNSPNVFMLETFLDELARETNRDPYALRRHLLRDDERGRAVLDAAAKSAGWGTRKLAPGRALGIAYFPHRGRGDSFVARVAQVAEVSVDARGGTRVHRIDVAIDTGTVINPRLLEAQMHSGIGWGLTQAFFGKISFDSGQVQQSNFHDYRMLTMAQMPRVEVTLIDNDHTPGGAGEVPVAAVAPAVANAILAASGRKLRRMPFSDEGITLL